MVIAKCQAGKPPTVTRLLLLPDEAEEPPLSISREHFSTAIAFGFDLAEQLLFRGEEVVEEPHDSIQRIRVAGEAFAQLLAGRIVKEVGARF